MIRELVVDGTTVLLTTQYLEEADQLAGRIAVIDGGHVIANDTPGRLKASSATRWSRWTSPTTTHRRAGARRCSAGDDLGKVEREHRTVRISSSRGAHVLVEVLRRLDADGIEPDTLSVREPSLDDVFLALTGHRAVSDDEPRRETPHEASTAAPTVERVDLDRRIAVRRGARHARDRAAEPDRLSAGARSSSSSPRSSRSSSCVMFRYVFGGAVAGALPAGVDYVDFLMPGIFVQTVVFGAIATSIGLASDLKSGLMERFHALPMARSAVLSGRTIADTSATCSWSC